MTCGAQIDELLMEHTRLSGAERRMRVMKMLDRVQLPDADRLYAAYPHQLSGGQRQRIMIAMALILRPSLLIADEPTTALDVTVQAQIMGLLDELQKDTGMGLILITHDLGVVAEVADRISVMYAGKIVETADIKEIFANPAHPYTLGLLKSLARPDVKGQPLEPIVGSPPDLLHLPTGCAFHPRCRFAEELCVNEIPERRSVAVNRTSACHFAGDILEGVGV
jgi:oligopeptide transport system ATP-binding protein